MGTARTDAGHQDGNSHDDTVSAAVRCENSCVHRVVVNAEQKCAIDATESRRGSVVSTHIHHFNSKPSDYVIVRLRGKEKSFSFLLFTVYIFIFLPV